MAQVTMNADGTVLMTLSPIEIVTLSDQITRQAFEEYCSLWIEHQTHQLFNDRFKTLSPEDQQLVLSKFTQGA